MLSVQYNKVNLKVLQVCCFMEIFWADQLDGKVLKAKV